MDESNLTSQYILNMEKRIVSGEWAVNTMLPSFRKLCSEYSVSRSVINTAVSVLHAKGFVDIVWFCVEITSIKLPHKPVTVRATLLLESDKKTIEETVEYKLKPEQRVYEGPSILLQ